MTATNLSDDDEYLDLAEDPDVAFRKLEKKFREELEEHLENSQGHHSDTLTLSYINRTIAAAKTLEIEPLKDWEVPSHRNNVWDEYQEFSTVVEHYLVQVQILHSRPVRGYSVRLDATTKSKIRHYLDRVREIVDRLEVPLPNKEALTAKITALSDEVDRDRTRFDAYAGLALEMAATGREVAQPSIRRASSSTASLVFWGTQSRPKTRGPASPLHKSANASPHREKNGFPRHRNGTGNATYWTTIFPFRACRAVQHPARLRDDTPPRLGSRLFPGQRRRELGLGPHPRPSLTRGSLRCR
jgi:hypothetical protein